MYPDGPRTSVQPGPLGAELEGASRPTHFAGMLTVVLKLLQIVRPDRAFFGEKDYQQLVLIRQMVADLNVDARIVGVPIVREPDGLAMSSRNRYLERRRTRAGRCAVGGPAGRHVRRVERARPRPSTPRARYSTRCPRSRSTTWKCATPGSEPAPVEGAARMLLAARLGATRLLDNIAIDIGADRRDRRRRPSGRMATTNCHGGIDVTERSAAVSSCC